MTAPKKDLHRGDADAIPLHHVVIAVDPGVAGVTHFFVDGKELFLGRNVGVNVDFRVDDLHRVTPEILAEHIEVITLAEMEQRTVKE